MNPTQSSGGQIIAPKGYRQRDYLAGWRACEADVVSQGQRIADLEDALERVTTNKETTMADGTIELIHTLNNLQGQVRQAQADLSQAFGESADDDTDSLLFDEAQRELNAAVVAVEGARTKVAAYVGFQQAYTEA